MARHLQRLRVGIIDALDLGLLDKGSLQLLQPKSPAISLTAAMQYTMGTRTGAQICFSFAAILDSHHLIYAEGPDPRKSRDLLAGTFKTLSVVSYLPCYIPLLRCQVSTGST